MKTATPRRSFPTPGGYDPPSDATSPGVTPADPSAGVAPTGDPEERGIPTEPTWASEIAEAKEYWNHYLAARSDLFRTRSSKMVWNLATGALAGIVGASLLAVAAAYLLAGIAGGLSLLFGGRPWAGDLATGALVIIAAGVGFTLIRMRAERARRLKLFEKYEQRRNLQQQRFGHDLSDRAAG